MIEDKEAKVHLGVSPLYRKRRISASEGDVDKEPDLFIILGGPKANR